MESIFGKGSKKRIFSQLTFSYINEPTVHKSSLYQKSYGHGQQPQVQCHFCVCWTGKCCCLWPTVHLAGEQSWHQFLTQVLQKTKMRQCGKLLSVSLSLIWKDTEKFTFQSCQLANFQQKEKPHFKNINKDGEGLTI